MKFFPFYTTFKSKATNKQMTNSSAENRNMTGFNLNWFLKDKNGSQLTDKLPPRQEDWKQEIPTPKYEQHWLEEMVQVARSAITSRSASPRTVTERSACFARTSPSPSRKPPAIMPAATMAELASHALVRGSRQNAVVADDEVTLLSVIAILPRCAGEICCE